jgi:DNA polymerase-1
VPRPCSPSTPLDALPGVLRAPQVDQGPGRQSGQRTSRHRKPHPPGGGDPRSASRGALLRSDAATYRLELFPAYHADREAAFPNALRPQWDDSADFFGAFGWKIAGSDSFEADDLLGTLAQKESKAGGRSLLMTGDRDMFQCADAKTKVLYVSTGKQGGQPMGPAEVKERYGIPPKLVPDLIALRGDPSDGIPGAKGVGEKTAVELLRKHGSLEKVLAAAIREPRPALRTALTGDRDQLLAFKDVATLRTAKVSRPRDKRTDYRGAAKAARERGMNRLAERLLEKARSA